ncbi:glycoside hydrolase family 43 protein [Prevotella sp. kh1p2]|uniref:glycoside hydrolase family 43 protein n=1 Tax=Prevotella sp. kh1p2 TaxID=1761883 RepID=UPI0008AFC4EF|nr:glycoside hydrolase family 43 protein [Prevotella sp. kh1p2]SES90302.1 Glycosyl hydrolases family 43 [Prevotella sp. kh1p2]SNU11594.1 Glycosyl hydrolases family 43 [Prevotellaceae bacterium KH2P17]
MKQFLLAAALLCSAAAATAQQPAGGNPIAGGWYADPEAIVLNQRYWVYPTYSAPYGEQTHFDAFSSPDLVHWTKHYHVLDAYNVPWARRAMWAPSVVKANNRFYFFFSANDVHEGETGGIGVAVAEKPEGPFRDAIGKPLVGHIVNGAQPIDQFVFCDDDGQWYMYYGGWRHCNVVRLAPDLLHIVPFTDGTTYKEITPQNYVEGPFMLKRGGKYYFMWSEGGWTGPDYCAAYAIGDSPLGPFRRIGKILQQDPEVATGAGHHSVIKGPGADEFYIVYHRRPLGETDGNHRVVCIDRLEFNADGTIRPVKLTFEGVKASPLKPE